MSWSTVRVEEGFLSVLTALSSRVTSGMAPVTLLLALSSSRPSMLNLALRAASIMPLLAGSALFRVPPPMVSAARSGSLLVI
ncbi:hypothetical protein D3C81_2060080 [compost metagenome]